MAKKSAKKSKPAAKKTAKGKKPAAKKAASKKAAPKKAAAKKPALTNITKHAAVTVTKKDVTIDLAALAKKAGAASSIKVTLSGKPVVEAAITGGKKKGGDEEE